MGIIGRIYYDFRKSRPIMVSYGTYFDKNREPIFNNFIVISEPKKANALYKHSPLKYIKMYPDFRAHLLRNNYQIMKRYLPFPAPVIFSVRCNEYIFPSNVDAGFSVIFNTSITSARPNTFSTPKAA